MVARELAGAVLMTGIPGPVLETGVFETLRDLAPSGIVLFQRNVENVGQLRALVRDLHALPSRPLVAIDHEGGAVVRLGAPFTQFPAARWITRTGDPALARAVGEAMGRELSAVGIDIDFAPVADVDSNPRNPVIGARSFGSTPRDVVRFIVPFMAGLQAAGVLPCAKHFPGHGDTECDSHHVLPVVRRSRAALQEIELPPFAAAISSGVPLIMTAHVLYPSLDDRLPATLSPRIVQELLRGEFGFTGVIVSDDLQMGAISGSMALPDAAVTALRAGVDWLLVCNDLDASVRVAERVARALDRNELDAARLSVAAGRIRALTAAARRSDPLELPDPAHEALNAEIRRLAEAPAARS